MIGTNPEAILLRKKKNSKLVALGILLTTFLALIPAATACTISSPTYKVQSSFRVVIWQEKTRISGIKIGLYRDTGDIESEPFFTARTDKDGTVKIEHLQAGIYYISVIDVGHGSAAYLVVAPNETREAQNEIALRWPFWGVIKTKRLAGVMFRESPFTNSPEGVLAKVPLELWKPGDEFPDEVINSDSNGRFHFKETQPGFYVIRVADPTSSSSAMRGDIGFQILPAQSKAPDFLRLLLLMTTCGLHTDAETK